MSHDSLPPPVTVGALTAVPIDITAVDASLRFDTTTRTATATATMRFVVGPTAGSPYFDLRQTITSATLDGAPVAVADLAHKVLGADPDAKLRVLARTLSAGSTHTLTLTYTLGTPDASHARAIDWVTAPRGVRWDFWFSDLYAGRYLEMWLPANLIHDAFALSLDLEVVGAESTHQLVTNGTATALSANHWSIACPAHWVSHQPMLVLSPASEMATLTRTVTMPSGSTVSVEVSRGHGAVATLSAVADSLAAALPAFETAAGRYAHGTRFVAHIWAEAGRSMEYAGATTSNVTSLLHETFHSWWARSMRPALGGDGWIDESWTTCNTDQHGLHAEAFPGTTAVTRLCELDPFYRRTPDAAYNVGAAFFRGLADDLGVTTVEDVMRALYTEKAPGPIRTADLQAAFIQRSGQVELADRFHRWVYGFETPATADGWLRDATDDAGTTPFSGTFWRSPDIWVRHADDDGTAHEDPEHGQDNWFYARVRNRGATTLESFVVTFTVKTFAGTQFQYPNDWGPFMGVAVGYGLPPGGTAIVRARWRRADVPPVGAHGCMLAQVYTPQDRTTAGVRVWESNNLAQRNLAIVDLLPDTTMDLRVRLGSRWTAGGAHRLELVRPIGHPGLSASLLSPKAERLSPLGRLPLAPFPSDTPAVIVEDAEVRMAFPIGLRAGWTATLPARRPVEAVLRLRCPADARPGDILPVNLLQRDAAGQIVGGIGVDIRVAKPVADDAPDHRSQPASAPYGSVGPPATARRT